MNGETVTVGPLKTSGNLKERLKQSGAYIEGFSSQAAVQKRVEKDRSMGSLEPSQGMRAYIEDLRLRRLRASRSMLLTSSPEGRVNLG